MVQRAYERRQSEPEATLEIIAGRLIPVVDALVANDPAERDHRYHSLLAQLLRRIPGNLDRAEKEINKAIEIRDKLQRGGWKWYEFQRARIGIEKDASFRMNEPSNEDLVARTRADLRAASSDPNWKRWYDDHRFIQNWMRLNLNISDSQQKP